MAEIFLRSGLVVLVDDEDLGVLSGYTWYSRPKDTADKPGHYAVATRKDSRSHIRMHRLIMNAPVGSQIDHINGNGLDNRKCNLRFCTSSQNQMNANRKCSHPTTSKYKGVYLDRGRGGNGKKWRSEIYKDGVKHRVGRFTTEEEAHSAYVEESKKLHGEFSFFSAAKFL